MYNYSYRHTFLWLLTHLTCAYNYAHQLIEFTINIIISHLFFNLAMVMNVQVKSVSATSVRVSWEIINSTEITNYTVYYRAISNRKRQDGEQSVTVPNNQNSVVIGELMSDVTYHFQVAAVVQGGSSFDFIGQRSDAVSPTSSTPTFPPSVPPSPGEY